MSDSVKGAARTAVDEIEQDIKNRVGFKFALVPPTMKDELRRAWQKIIERAIEEAKKP